jgi:hypothetical protein
MRLAAVMLLLVAGCTETGPDRRTEPLSSPASVSVSVSPPAVSLGVFEAAGIRATRAIPELGEGRYFHLTDANDDIVVAGTTLIANSVDRNLRSNRVMTSTDRGRTWQGIDLPGATADDGWAILSRTGTTVAAVGGGKRHLVWLTDDGVTWRGGPVPVESEGYVLALPLRGVDGAVVVANSRKGARIVRTTDGGGTWQTIDCPTMFRPTGQADRCEVVTPAGGNLWARRFEVSVDAGKTWRPVKVVPEFGSVIQLMGTVTLQGGGWLSPVWTVIPPAKSAYLLARSRDGVTWDTVIPYPCDKAAGQGATVSRPQALGNRWLVAYTCVDATDDAQRSVLYLLEADGTGARVLAAIDRPGRWFGGPVTVGDTVIVPEIRNDNVVTLLHLNV